MKISAAKIFFLLGCTASNSVLSETITIGKGTGIIWEGLPYNVTLSGSMDYAQFNPIYGLLSISSISTRCMYSSYLTDIAGFKAYKIAPGVGLIPRAIGNSSYTSATGIKQAFTGTIGLPETRGGTSGELTSPSGYDWCLPPAMSSSASFYDPKALRTSNISGTWVLVTDGSQQNSQFSLPAMYAGSYSVVHSGDRTQTILPSNITLRISTLECTVNTPTAINFGSVARDIHKGTELGKVANTFVTTCGQQSNKIDANINVQFRALTSLYDNSKYQLALAEGGGYITGEIEGITGNGSCSNNTGISFDNAAIKIGNITSNQSSLSLSHQLIWRLCSGGGNLPTGPVSSSAEMLVTFN